MAVTTEKSTQVTNMEATPPVRLAAGELHGRMRIARFTFTQGAAAGDANSTADLVKLPAGKNVTLLKNLSRITCSALGAARVVDIGHTGYTNIDGTVIAAAADNLLDGGDVSAAATLSMGAGTNGLTANDAVVFNSRGGATLQAKVTGGTIPAGATLNGYFVYIED